METLAKELHKPARRRYPRRKTKATFVDDLWQIDLVEMIPYSRVNKGYKYLLTQIDVYSKFARAEPIKSKSGPDVTTAFEKMLVSTKPRLLQSDEGTEFFNSEFSALTKRLGINHYHTYSETKASVVERFNRTLKTLMWREFTRRGSYKWVDLLPSLLHKYNSSVHRTIKARPKDVVAGAVKLPKPSIPKRLKSSSKFKVGDKVRISKVKMVFDKGYLQNWTNEIYTIDKVRKTTNPVTYTLKDYGGEEIIGGFYDWELQKTTVPDLFLVEKVLNTKKVRGKTSYLVKWRGYDDKFNSWVDNLDSFG